MRIGVIGTGSVGLVTGACLADFGHEVVCADQDPALLGQLQQRLEEPSHEPGLDELVRAQVAAGRLRFGDVGEAVRDADMALIETGGADLAQVLSAAEAIGQALTGYMVVAIRQVVPAGTAEMVTAVLREATAQPFSVVANPKFLDHEMRRHAFCRDREARGAAGSDREGRSAAAG